MSDMRACLGPSGRGCPDRRIMPREQMFQRFTMLRLAGAKGGGRQRTMAGRGSDEYVCPTCARIEDHEIKHGSGPITEPGRLAI